MHQTFEKFNEFRRNTLSFIIISPPGNALIFPGERGGRILKFPGDPRTGDPRGQALKLPQLDTLLRIQSRNF